MCRDSRQLRGFRGQRAVGRNKRALILYHVIERVGDLEMRRFDEGIGEILDVLY